MRKFKVGMAAVLILGIVVLFFVVNAFAQSASERLNCPSGALSIFDVQEGINVECVNALFATLTPTTDAPTDTPVPPTDTPVPLTDTPVPSGHDPETYHPLTEEFAHTHHYDPSRFDSVFGPVGDLYGGQEISYPWQTWKDVGIDAPPMPGLMENDIAHTGYKWEVRDVNDPELAALGVPPNCSIDALQFIDPICITKWRVQYHTVGGSRASDHRFHSYWAELEICLEDGSQCGTFKTGGHNDFGILAIPYRGVHVPLPDDPDPITTTTAQFPYRVHRVPGHENTDCFLGADQCRYFWASSAHYGYNQFFEFLFRVKDNWQGIKIEDPTEEAPICPDGSCGLNHSNHFVFQMKVRLNELVAMNPEAPTLNYSGFTDRRGNIVADCAPLGVDCIPFEVSGVPNPILHGKRKWAGVDMGADKLGPLERPFSFEFEHDISPSGESWIVYPYPLP